MFINRYKILNIIEDYKRFLKKIKDLRPYLFKLNENDILKNKTYLFNNIISIKNYGLIIIISYDGYIFSINNSIYKT